MIQERGSVLPASSDTTQVFPDETGREIQIEKMAEKTYPRINFDADYLRTFDLSESQARELLSQARESVFSMGVGDAADQIGETVSRLFVAKMFYVQQKLGRSCYASVIHPPDATIQTYHAKFMRCVPEAAKITWGASFSEEMFVPAEIDIDFCGMIAVGMEKPIDAFGLARSISRLKRERQFVDGNELDTNCVLPGNHFANIYQVVNHQEFHLPPYMGFAHLAADEYRNRLRDIAEKEAIRIQTPFGECLALVGSHASKYWQLAQEGSFFARKKREFIAAKIFGSDFIISNDTHYEMIDPFSCIIGANEVGGENDFHIIVSNPCEQAFLVKGKKGIALNIVNELGFSSSDPLFFNLLTASVLPHGSGHSLPEDISLKEVNITADGIFYVTNLRGGTERVTAHYQTIPTASRTSVMENVLRYGLISRDFVALKPLCSVKA